MEPVANHDLENLKPLPEELQNLSKDESICKFCGIPYLILHEVKTLQDRNKDLEKKLVDYEEAINIRASLEEELAKAKTELKRLEELPALKSEFGRLHELVSTLEEDNKELEDENHKLITEAASKEEKFMNMTMQNENLLSENEKNLQEISKIKEENITIKTKLATACSDQENQEALFNQALQPHLIKIKEYEILVDELNKNIKNQTDSNKSLVSENANLDNKIINLSDEFKTLKNKHDSTVSTLSMTRTELEHKAKQIDELDHNNSKILQENASKVSMIEHLENQLEINRGTFNLKTKQFEEKLLNETSKIKNMELNFNEQNSSIEIFKKNEEVMRGQLVDMQTSNQHLKTQIQNLTDKHNNLQSEHQQTIASHNGRLQEITEFYRAELAKTKNSSVSTENLESLKKQHENEILDREKSLKEYFQVELEIQVEKETNKVKKDVQNTIFSLEDEITSIKETKKSLESHNNDLERQLKSNRSRSLAIENDLNGKIGNYKSTCDKLRIDNSELLKKNMLAEESIKNAANINPDRSSEIKKLSLKSSNDEEKIKKLETTVQKQCEERIELLEEISNLKNRGEEGDTKRDHKEHRTLKLLELNEADRTSDNLRNSIRRVDKPESLKSTSVHSLNNGNNKIEAKYEPVSFLPQSLADLTGRTKSPLPSLRSQTGGENGYQNIQTGYQGGTYHTINQGPSTNSGGFKAISGGDNPSIYNKINKPNLRYASPNISPNKSVAKSNLSNSIKSSNVSINQEENDMDNLRRKIRLAIRQRQRKEKS